MITEVLTHVNKGINYFITGFKFQTTHVCVDYNSDGIYYSKDKYLMNFNESFGTHFYQRVNGEVSIQSEFFSSNIRTYVFNYPIRLVGFVNLVPSSLDSSTVSERVLWSLSKVESEWMQKAVNRYSFDISSVNIDKFLVFQDELKSQEVPNLDNVSIFAIDYNLIIYSQIDLCKLIECCVI